MTQNFDPAGINGAPRLKNSLKALLPLLPYVARYRGRIAAGFLALTVASIATLTVPSGAVQSGSFVPTGTLALGEGMKVNIDITSIPQGANAFPGKNLSLQIRT